MLSKEWTLIGAILVVTLGLDALSKSLVERRIVPGMTLFRVGGVMRLEHVHNARAALGLFGEERVASGLVGGIVAVGMVIWVIAATDSGLPTSVIWPVGLVLGGGAGNLGEQLLNGQVIDFLGVNLGPARWTVFNLADMFALVGIVVWISGIVTYKPGKVIESTTWW